MVHRKEVLLGCYICRVQIPSVPVIKQHLNNKVRFCLPQYKIKISNRTCNYIKKWLINHIILRHTHI